MKSFGLMESVITPPHYYSMIITDSLGEWDRLGELGPTVLRLRNDDYFKIVTFHDSYNYTYSIRKLLFFKGGRIWFFRLPTIAINTSRAMNLVGKRLVRIEYVYR
jgi:hypothetical protein